MSEAKKGELAIRDKAILHQQRRLKQATQFTHKDSADLLPLDGLKRLGTSKDLVSGAEPQSVCVYVCVCARACVDEQGFLMAVSLFDRIDAAESFKHHILLVPPLPIMQPGWLKPRFRWVTVLAANEVLILTF